MSWVEVPANSNETFFNVAVTLPVGQWVIHADVASDIYPATESPYVAVGDAQIVKQRTWERGMATDSFAVVDVGEAGAEVRLDLKTGISTSVAFAMLTATPLSD